MGWRWEFQHALRPEVAQAMQRVRREDFMAPGQRDRAGENRAHPIGLGQTISQPELVGTMTEELRLTPRSRVLEIGTGSGYQTAILAELAGEIFTVERLPSLAEIAAQRLQLARVPVHVRCGDGSLGWPEAAPFDAIIVTAAAEQVPPALVEQLAMPGRLVIPIGPADGDQQLYLLEKQPGGAVRQRELGPVRFVPLVSD